VKNIYEKVFIVFLVAITLFFAAYKLTESPPTWFDEGFVIQSAENLVNDGIMGIKIEPDLIVHNATFFSTGFPLAYPVGWAMELFGRGLLPARSVMVLFTILLVLLCYFLAKKIWGFKIAAFSSLLLVGFAPLYGNGRNVLGEVPGVFFLVLFLYYLYKIEKKKFVGSYSDYIMAGLSVALCLSTKSIFLVLPLAVILALIIFYKNIAWDWRRILAGLAAGSVVIAVLLKTQFLGGGPLVDVLRDYANPYAVGDMSVLVWQNIKRFFTEGTPIYLLGTMLIWLLSLAIRKIRSETTSLTEIVSFFFSLFICLSYLRMVGWYRYLFAAQILSLLFLPASSLIMFEWLKSKFAWSRNINIKIVFILFGVLIGAQFLYLHYFSWTASYYYSRATSSLENYFNRIDFSEKIFLYNSPEIATFLPSKNYYQYLKINDELILGQDQLKQITVGVPNKVIVNNKEASVMADFPLYQEAGAVSRYLIFEKK